VNINSSISLPLNESSLTKETEPVEKLEIFVKDGHGLTVEICNNGDIDAENIQLNIDVDVGKLVIIPKKIYEIPYLATGKSTEVYVSIFGLGLAIFFEHPLISITVNCPGFKTTWTKVLTKLFGMSTKILTRMTNYNDPYEGYTLFGPEYSTFTYLIDMDGKIVHLWKSDYIQGFGTYLLENGDLLRLDEFGGDISFMAGGRAGRVEKFDNHSNLLWEYVYANDEHCSHHDIEPLPNGNVLIIAWESKTKQEAIYAGRNPNRLRSTALWPDHVIEVEPVGSSGGNIVWEWHVWDHLVQDYDSTKENYGVVVDHPELVDVNYGTTDSDWNHMNAVDYNEEFDQILLSVHNFNEIWVIDHSTTTEEAAGHTGGNSGKGGDLLYRWGNPAAYDAGDSSDQKYFGQHGANWIDKGCPGEGNILVFNNGRQALKYSSVDEIVPPVDNSGNYKYVPGQAYGPDKLIWVYTAETPTDMFSMTLSSAQRLPNGNTLICSANQGLIVEVSQEKEIVWEYKYQNFLYPNANSVARVQRYSLDYPGIPRATSINEN
jgi:Arylsulfotransferase (ASST)